MPGLCRAAGTIRGFSALQRAEIAEIVDLGFRNPEGAVCFSALQRAEIAEIAVQQAVQFATARFSALQRAEIAEIPQICVGVSAGLAFQCSSTSRNC